VGALKRIVGATRNSQHLLLFVANTILLCFTSGNINNYSYKMAAHENDKKTSSTTSPTNL
jgi:hypothetical protein